MAGTGEVMVQLFSCCITQQPSPSRRKPQRMRIDRSMIGNPTNFVHTGHIGSNDAELSSQHLTIIQSQMQSKGGYDLNSLRLQVKIVPIVTATKFIFHDSLAGMLIDKIAAFFICWILGIVRTQFHQV